MYINLLNRKGTLCDQNKFQICLRHVAPWQFHGSLRGAPVAPKQTPVQKGDRFAFLGQVRKFVDPGAYRIESPNGDHQPDNVAFQNPDGSLALIVHAQVDTDLEVTWRGQHFTYHLSSYATATFKWTAP